VRRGLAASGEQARAAVAAGRVLVSGARADKPSRLVAASEPVEVVGAGPRYVSRGGEKLDAALTRFDVPVDGRVALDAGASTGGFTDCLLQHGAARVLAVDVGHGQLDARLRADPRVSLWERTNARDLSPRDLDRPGDPFRGVELLVADLSFISLTVVLPALVPLVVPTGDLVVLVKPQFEAGRVEVSRGRGVVRHPAAWRQALLDVASALERAGTGIMGVMPSPLTGQAGNVEFLVHARRPPHGSSPGARRLVEAAVDEAADGPSD
jgi:23S rRNA (cytidine1920-2'-O)/16S rRNA (cytidine1409-2'-O)-methyltransferase